MIRERPRNIPSKAEHAAGSGEAAVLRHRIDELAGPLDSVGGQNAMKVAKLRDNGWSNDGLHQLGLTEVPSPPTTGRRGTARPGPAPRTLEDASPTTTDGSPTPLIATTV